MIFQIASSNCKVLRKMVREYYPHLDKFGRDMMTGLICSIINDQYRPQIGGAAYGDFSRYRTMMVDAQMIVSEYNKIN